MVSVMFLILADARRGKRPGQRRLNGRSTVDGVATCLAAIGILCKLQIVRVSLILKPVLKHYLVFLAI